MKQNKPLISVIVAMAQNRVIGKENKLPWHLPADLRQFKAMTVGKPIVMGRKTWESLPGILPERTHIVITSNPDYRADGCVLVGSLEEAIEAAGDVPEVMIVGGAQIYTQALPMADRLYLTIVETDVEGDAVFPEIDDSRWQETAREYHNKDERNPYSFSFVTLSRI